MCFGSLDCFSLFRLIYVVPRQARRCSDGPRGPESPWSHYQPLETQAMYKHLQGTGSVWEWLLENTHRCAPVSGFQTVKLTLSQSAHVNRGNGVLHRSLVNMCTLRHTLETIHFDGLPPFFRLLVWWFNEQTSSQWWPTILTETQM